MVELTEQQRAIVEATEPYIVVVATAAAGKTRCITERVRWLLNQGVPAEEIVTITFTNAAAEEISERLGNPTGLFIGTIHSLANYYLRAGGVDTSKILNDERFDDLFKLIKKNPECVRQVSYLIVDEAQDSNPQQFEFLLDMINPKNYMLMGDHRQSIYRFNGATPDYILNLMESPEVTTYDLNENYRNAPEILAYAQQLIKTLGYDFRNTNIFNTFEECKSSVLAVSDSIISALHRAVNDDDKQNAMAAINENRLHRFFNLMERMNNRYNENYKYELSEGIINRPSDDAIMSFLGELGLNIEDDSVETNELM